MDIDGTEAHVRPILKGGTSLSKAYGLIQRFSEDVDPLVPIPVDGPTTYSQNQRTDYPTTRSDPVRSSSDQNPRELRPVIALAADHAATGHLFVPSALMSEHYSRHHSIARYGPKSTVACKAVDRPAMATAATPTAARPTSHNEAWDRMASVRLRKFTSSPHDVRNRAP